MADTNRTFQIRSAGKPRSDIKGDVRGGGASQVPPLRSIRASRGCKRSLFRIRRQRLLRERSRAASGARPTRSAPIPASTRPGRLSVAGASRSLTRSGSWPESRRQLDGRSPWSAPAWKSIYRGRSSKEARALFGVRLELRKRRRSLLHVPAVQGWVTPFPDSKPGDIGRPVGDSSDNAEYGWSRAKLVERTNGGRGTGQRWGASESG